MRSKDEIFNDLRSVLASLLKVSDSEISMESGIRVLKPWSSLNHIRVITAIEDYFKISFTNNEIVQLTTVVMLVNTIEEKLKNEEAG